MKWTPADGIRPVLISGEEIVSQGTVVLQWLFERKDETTYNKTQHATFNIMKTNVCQMVIGCQWMINNQDELPEIWPLNPMVANNKKLSRGAYS